MESGLSTGIWKKTPSEKEFRGGRMSFSSEVKEELSRHLPTARHCQIAETAAILSLCGQISEKDGTIRIQTENAYVARKYFTLLKKTFNIEAELAVKLNQKENTYLIRANDREETRQILQAVKLHETDRQLTMPIPAVVVQRQCCKRAFLRGAFLASGSISDPNRFYHLEIVCPDAPRAEQVQELLKSFGTDRSPEKPPCGLYERRRTDCGDAWHHGSQHRTYESGKRADLKRNARQCQPKGEL